MERDWTRLAHELRRSRDSQGMTQEDLAKAAGVVRQTVQNLESGEERSRMPPTLRKVTAALGWPDGRAQAILDGRDTPEETAPQPPRFADGMPLRVARELAEGQVVDTEVLDLSQPGSTSRLVVVYKRDADAADMDPDQLRRELEEWTRMQRALRNLGTPPEEPADEA